VSLNGPEREVPGIATLSMTGRLRIPHLGWCDATWVLRRRPFHARGRCTATRRIRCGERSRVKSDLAGSCVAQLLRGLR
jgi:hypothetical protein